MRAVTLWIAAKKKLNNNKDDDDAWKLFAYEDFSPQPQFLITSPGVRNKSSENEESLRLQQKEDTLTSSNNLVLTKVKDILYSPQDLLSFYNTLRVEVWEETRASLPVFPRFARLILQDLFNVFICLLFGWKEILPSAEIPHENFSLILLTLII